MDGALSQLLRGTYGGYGYNGLELPTFSAVRAASSCGTLHSPTPTPKSHGQLVETDRNDHASQLLPACFIVESPGLSPECLAQGQTWCSGTDQELMSTCASVSACFR